MVRLYPGPYPTGLLDQTGKWKIIGVVGTRPVQGKRTKGFSGTSQPDNPIAKLHGHQALTLHIEFLINKWITSFLNMIRQLGITGYLRFETDKLGNKGS